MQVYVVVILYVWLAAWFEDEHVRLDAGSKWSGNFELGGDELAITSLCVG